MKPHRSLRIPACRYHKARALAVVTVRQPDGRRKNIYLGPWKSEQAATEYARIIAELANPRITLSAGVGEDLSIAELMVVYIRHVDGYYRRPDGTPTHEVVENRLSLRPLRELYGLTPAARFGPLDLETVRHRMIEARWCRSLINRRVGRIRRMFKWAVAKQIVPPTVLVSLNALDGLKVGRSAAKETEPVVPVDTAVVDATLPHLPRHVAGLVRFQFLTGCRPGEACSLRRCDLDMSGPIWLYRPTWHKLAYRNKPRVIAVGPKAQGVLAEFPTFDPTAYVFSPAKAVTEFHTTRSVARVTPLYPSHLARNERKRVKVGKRPPGAKYTTQSYGRAVAEGCDRTFPPPDHLARRPDEPLAEWSARLTDGECDELKVWRRFHRWHPNQLRHAFASRVRKQYGLEAAQVTLGHARADVTQVYAERDLRLAAEVAGKVG